MSKWTEFVETLPNGKEYLENQCLEFLKSYNKSKVPVIQESAPRIAVPFVNRTTSVRAIRRTSDKLREENKKYLAVIQQANPNTISAEEIARDLGMPKLPQLWQKSLLENGCIEKLGSKRFTRYRFLKNFEEIGATIEN